MTYMSDYPDGKLIVCAQCGAEFAFTRKMKAGRKYCDRNCYREASRQFDSRPYPEVWYNGKKEYLHRAIYMEHHGVTLSSEDIIHHIDENPFNRHPDNLERVTDRAAHLAKHNYYRREQQVDYAAILAETTPAYTEDIPF